MLKMSAERRGGCGELTIIDIVGFDSSFTERIIQ